MVFYCIALEMSFDRVLKFIIKKLNFRLRLVTYVRNGRLEEYNPFISKNNK